MLKHVNILHSVEFTVEASVNDNFVSMLFNKSKISLLEMPGEVSFGSLGSGVGDGLATGSSDSLG